MLKREDGLNLLTLDDLREFAKAYSSKKKKAVKYRGEVRSLICNDCNMGKGNWDETDWRKE